MALFREHISVGAIVAIIGVVLAYHYAYVTDWRLLAWLFVVTVVASMLPDVDSDSSLPFHFVYGLFTVICVGVALLYTLVTGWDSWYELAGRPLVVGIVVWFVVGGIVKRLTKHRGMFHSLPAALILSLCHLLVVRALGYGDTAGVLLAAGAGLGYIAHLVLDELHSTVSVDGSLFKPRRSLGTALKLFSGSRTATIFTYVLLATLVYAAL